MSHTPGPWFSDIKGWGCAVFSVLKGNVARDICNTSTTDDLEENKANALLIAAAPELLEALEKFVAHMPSKSHCTIGHLQAYDLAETAIAKAKGENHA